MMSPVLDVASRAACRDRCSGSRASCASSTSTCGSSRRATGRRPIRRSSSVGPTRRVGVERFDRADRARTRRPRAARPRRCAASSPTSCTCTSRRCPGPCLSALIGFNGPMVGTFHASGELPHMWTAARAAVGDAAARRSASRSRSRRARPRRANWNGDDYVVLWNGIEIERIASAEPDAVAAPGACCSSGATNRARDSRCCSTRGPASIATPSCGSIGAGPQTDELRAPRRSETSSGSARSPTPNATRGCAARPCSARRRWAASRSASCCSRRWPRARRSSRRRSRATRTSRAPTATRCSCRRATSRRCATRCGACSTTRRCATGSSRPATSGPASSRCARLAERYLELYERSLVRAAR